MKKLNEILTKIRANKKTILEIGDPSDRISLNDDKKIDLISLIYDQFIQGKEDLLMPFFSKQGIYIDKDNPEQIRNLLISALSSK